MQVSDKSFHIGTGFEYVLLYPDGSEIIKLPGSTQPFVLEKHREDVGRQHNRITLFICTKSDFLFSEMPTKTTVGSDPDTSDDELSSMKSIFNSSDTVS